MNVRSATVFKKRMKKKKACDRKHYKANSESKKESAKAQYWLDPESKKKSAKVQYWLDPERKKESMKAHYDQNRELILASKQAQNQESYLKEKKQPQEKKSYEVGVFACNVLYRLGTICPTFIHAQGTGILCALFISCE